MMEFFTGVLAMQGAYARHCEVLSRLGMPVIEVRSIEDLKRCARLIIPGGESTTIYRLLMQAGLWQPLLERIQAGMPVFGTCAGMILLAARIRGVGRDYIDKIGHDDKGTLQNQYQNQDNSYQPCLAAIDLELQRNAYGPQIASFRTVLDIMDPLSQTLPESTPFAAFIQRKFGRFRKLAPDDVASDNAFLKLPLIFIRAPLALRWGAEVQVLLRYNPFPTEQTGQAICLQQGNILVSSFHPELSSSSLLHEYFLQL